MEPKSSSATARRVASGLGLGPLLLRFWHQPVGRLRNVIAQGGPVVMRATERGRSEMEVAAAHLPPLPNFPGSPRVTLHVLTGKRYWYQTAFCLSSFAQHAQVGIDVEIYDDGSVDPGLVEQIKSFAPRARAHPHAEIVARLHEHLPEASFPALHERWRNYPNIRKLINPHLGFSGWKLVIDSDLLFFRRPDFILEWLRAPDRPLHAVDCEESYGYPRKLLENLAGAPLPALVNVGLCGWRSEDLDWNELERWCRKLTMDYRPSYYLEQALVVMLSAQHACAIAPTADYVTLPRPPEAIECRAVMHHYVAESKRWYFQRNWRDIAIAAQSAPGTVR